MEIDDIRRVLIVGAGTMGQQIGLQCAMHSYDVMLYDIVPGALETAKAQIQAYAFLLVAVGRLTQDESDAALARVTTTGNPEEAAAGADLLSESVPEEPDLKGRVFAQFNGLCPPRTIFTTNTSTLLPSTFAADTGRPSQFAALHFHAPMLGANVVDIMPHPGTSEETIKLLKAFARRIGQTPIVLKQESPGYVYNAMQDAWFRAAIILFMNGVASIEDIDRAWMGVTQMPIGPFGMLDAIGLETIWHIVDCKAKATDDPVDKAGADFFKQYIDRGWLGVKSGRGFYTYPGPVYQQPDFLTGQQDSECLS